MVAKGIAGKCDMLDVSWCCNLTLQQIRPQVIMPVVAARDGVGGHLGEALGRRVPHLGRQHRRGICEHQRLLLAPAPQYAACQLTSLGCLVIQVSSVIAAQ